jgi:predicted DNA-binding transcriptional regulator AlpA
MQSATLPQTGYVRLPAVLAVYPVSKSTLWQRVKQGRFPAPVKLSERVTAWKVETLREFLASAGEV